MTFEASTQRPLLCDCSQAPLPHRINNTVETLWGNFLLRFLKPSVIIWNLDRNFYDKMPWCAFTHAHTHIHTGLGMETISWSVQRRAVFTFVCAFNSSMIEYHSSAVHRCAKLLPSGWQVVVIASVPHLWARLLKAALEFLEKPVWINLWNTEWLSPIKD